MGIFEEHFFGSFGTKNRVGRVAGTTATIYIFGLASSPVGLVAVSATMYQYLNLICIISIILR
jgi:hypothetical protein